MGRHQRVAHRFIQSLSDQYLARTLVEVVPPVQVAYLDPPSGQRARNPVVTVDPADLLDQVLGDGAIQAEVGRNGT